MSFSLTGFRWNSQNTQNLILKASEVKVDPEELKDAVPMEEPKPLVEIEPSGDGYTELDAMMSKYKQADIQTSFTMQKNKIDELAMTNFDLNQLKEKGLTEEEIAKYFDHTQVENSEGKVVSDYYRIKSSTINGVECKTLEEAVKAIKENKANNSIDELANKYMNGELEFGELKAELEKAGATDVRYERGDSGKCVIRFTLNGVSSAILNNRNEFQQSVNMDTGEVTTVGVNNKADKAPDENQYGSRDLLKLVYNLSDEEINKYFTPTKISDGHFVTYILNPDIKINGVECKTIDDLKKALNK